LSVALTAGANDEEHEGEEDVHEGGEGEEERLPGLTGTGGIYLLEVTADTAVANAPVTAAASNSTVDSDEVRHAAFDTNMCSRATQCIRFLDRFIIDYATN
jgi:hypothetical protein